VKCGCVYSRGRVVAQFSAEGLAKLLLHTSPQALHGLIGERHAADQLLDFAHTFCTAARRIAPEFNSKGPATSIHVS
jgi:hypothetical protein